MSMTDPVADLLARIKNAKLAKLDKIEMPASRLKASILKVLRDEGFIDAFKIVKDGQRAFLKISLKYDDKGNSVINGIRRVSRPGLRKYIKSSEITNVRSGSGLSIVSTSKGIMTGKAAKTSKLGGEILCEVW